MFILKFTDNIEDKTTRKFFDTFEEACAAMENEWDDYANGLHGNPDFLADLEEERDNEERRCYRELGKDTAYAELAYLSEDNPTYEWEVKQAKKFYVDFSLRVSECRVIAAEDEDAAKEIADQMLYDRDKGEEYWNGIIESMDNDFENWRKKYCEIEVLEETSDDENADNMEV